MDPQLSEINVVFAIHTENIQSILYTHTHKWCKNDIEDLSGISHKTFL